MILISLSLLIYCEISKSVAAIPVDEYYEKSSKYRLYPMTVWGNEVLKFIPFIGEKAGIKVTLHHLAGNAMHILGMHDKDERYFQSIRRNDMSWYIAGCQTNEDAENELFNYVQRQPEDVLPGRNSEEDLKRIIELFNQWENLHNDAEAIHQFFINVKTSENELNGYRRQRTRGFNSNYRDTSTSSDSDSDNGTSGGYLNPPYPTSVERKFPRW